MTRTVTGLCVAAAFGMVATLGAQTTGQTTTGTTDQTQRSHSAMSDRSSSKDEVTLTGCLQKGADGNYILTNARVDSGMGDMSSMHGSTGTTSGTTGTSTTAGTTTGSTASGSATGATTTSEANRGGMESSVMTWQLSGGKDLDKHVGHKIQVTGKAEMNSSSRQEENESASTGSTGTTAGAMTGSTAGTTGSTAGTTGSTAGTTGTTSETGSMQHQGMTGSTAGSANAHRLDVKSVKMVSTSCS